MIACEGSQDGSGPVPGLWTRIRLAMLQDLPDRLARVFEFTGDLAGWTCHPDAPSEWHRNRPP